MEQNRIQITNKQINKNGNKENKKKSRSITEVLKVSLKIAR